MKNIFSVLYLVLEYSNLAVCVQRIGTRRTSSRAEENLQRYTSHKLAVSGQNLKLHNVKGITGDEWDINEKSLLNAAASRYVSDPQIDGAANYIESEFRKLGLEVTYDFFESPSGKNIIGKLPGTASSESILIGAHYDSLPSSGPAPGADDNASGVATMLTVAQALVGTKLKRNIIFAAFSGEEQGMVGSSHYVQSQAFADSHVIASFILDQDGNPGSDRGIIFETLNSNPDNLRLIDTLASGVDAFTTIGSVSVNYDGFGSDHVSLSNAGVPSVLVIERDNMKFALQYGHSSRDTLANIDPLYGKGIAEIVLRAIVNLAEV